MPSWTSVAGKKNKYMPLDAKVWRRSIFYGILLGVLIGLLLRVFGSLVRNGRGFSGEMTVAFITLGPLVVGFFSCYPGARRGELSVARVLGIACASMLGTCLASALLLLEGSICIVMLLPIGIALSFLGGCVAYVVGRRLPYPPATLSCIALLPVVLAWFEAGHRPPPTVRTVEDTICIHANAAEVWQHIQSVAPIAPSELETTWTHRVGFPRPVAAVLSHPGVGGVRTATFEHGLTFYETVTTWAPSNRLAFSIKADTAHIPATTLDEHVTIGGPYFDVLDGEYRIEPRQDETILLHLTSHQRLSTDFNGYAGLWSDAVMRSLQRSILKVIQRRSEAAGHLVSDNTNP